MTHGTGVGSPAPSSWFLFLLLWGRSSGAGSSGDEHTQQCSGGNLVQVLFQWVAAASTLGSG